MIQTGLQSEKMVNYEENESDDEEEMKKREGEGEFKILMNAFKFTAIERPGSSTIAAEQKMCKI